MKYSEIHIWGDSLARGVIYNEAKGRYALSPERCTNRLQEELNCQVVNHSVMGATVLDGLRVFDAFKPVKNALCAIEFGGNDCDLDWPWVAEHPQEAIAGKVPLAQYQEALEAFVARVRQGEMTPLLVTPLPLHARRYFNWVTHGLDDERILLALGDVEHIYRWQERYTIAMRQTAQKTGCRLLDTRDAFLALQHYENYLCIDGIHPNDQGHRVVSEIALAAARADESVLTK